MDVYEKVSIVIPCYNGERLMHNSLDSILRQTYRNIQVLLINDGSTDATEEIAKQYMTKFGEAGMEFLYFKKENGGAASAVNVGLRHFTGDYLLWFDSDDILLPEAVEEYVTFLRDNPCFDYCMGEGATVQEENTEELIATIKRVPPENETKDDMLCDLIMGVNTVYGPGTVCARKQLINRAIPKAGICESREGQNWQLLIPITYYGSRGYIHKTMFKCVEHGDSHSRRRRGPDAMIDREMEFIRLCTATIDQISEMPAEDRAKYRDAIKIMHFRNIHRICLRYGRLKQGIQTAAALRMMGRTDWRYRGLLPGYISYMIEKISC